MLKAILPATVREKESAENHVKKLIHVKVKEWCATNKPGDLFDTDALKAHKKLWDCMRRDKYGVEG